MAKKDVFDTKQEIRREYEIAQANLTISRHKAVIALSKKFSSMMSAALKMV